MAAPPDATTDRDDRRRRLRRLGAPLQVPWPAVAVAAAALLAHVVAGT